MLGVTFAQWTQNIPSKRYEEDMTFISHVKKIFYSLTVLVHTCKTLFLPFYHAGARLTKGCVETFPE